MKKANLKLAWASKKAAAYACLNWHYSKTVPSGKLIMIGVWEEKKYIGCIIFGRGSSPYLGRKYGLKMHECCELVRVALRDHKTPVSRMISIAIKMLKQKVPGVRMIVSFASIDAGHIGAIYQAGNWIYTGSSDPMPEVYYNGKRTTWRTASNLVSKSKYSFKEIKAKGFITELPASPKLRYIMPLDNEMRQVAEGMRKPYPKRAK